MNQRISCSVLASLLVVLAVGCAPARIALKPTFWEQGPRKLGVAMTLPPPLSAHRAGAQGLLDVAINTAAAGSLEAHLKTLEAPRLDDTAGQFVEKLAARGVEARRLDEPIILETFHPFQAGSFGNYLERDLRPLGKGEGIDALILLRVEQCGTLRNYYGFIPLGDPAGYCTCRGELIDLKTNEVLWRAATPVEVATVKVEGKWEQPPDFPNLTGAVKQATERAPQFLLAEFFEARDQQGGKERRATTATPHLGAMQ